MPVTTATRRHHGSRGGIAKRSKDLRADRDGDLVMGAAPRGRSQPTRGGRGGRGGRGDMQATRQTPTASTPEPRRGGHVSSLKKEQLLKALQRGNFRGNGVGRSEPTRSGNIRITGWKKSDLSTNSDGGLGGFIQWLERRVNISIRKRNAPGKTAPPRTFKLATNKVRTTTDYQRYLAFFLPLMPFDNPF